MGPDASRENEGRTPLDYLRVLRRRIALIVTVALVAIGGALAYSLAREPQYVATSDLNFTTPLLGPTPPQLEQEKLAAANSATVETPAVVERVQKKLDRKKGLDLSGSELRDAVTTRVEAQSNLVVIEAQAHRASLAADIANTFARETASYATDRDRHRYAVAAQELRERADEIPPDRESREEYFKRLTNLVTQSSTAEPVEVERLADTPSSPASPRPLRDAALGGFLGLMLGVIAAFVRDSLDRRLNDVGQIEQSIGLPIIGHVRDGALGQAGVSRNGRVEMPERDLETFRILRSNLGFLDHERDLRSIVVTGPEPKAGKTTVVTSLGFASAFAGKRTLIVECDLRRPALAERLGLRRKPGLTDHLVDGISVEEITQTVSLQVDELSALRSARREIDTSGIFAKGQLACVTAGAHSERPTELLASRRFDDFLAGMKASYDLVLLDSPPLLLVGDVLQLVPRADGAVLCVRLMQTTRDQALAAETALASLPHRPTGLVVTGLRDRLAAGHEVGYYAAEEDETATERRSRARWWRRWSLLRPWRILRRRA